MEPYNPSITSFGQLPIELVEIILSFTPYESIPNAIIVCKFWAHYLDKKSRYIKEYIYKLSHINFFSTPLHSRNINLHFEFVPSIHNNIDTESIWKSTPYLYSKFGYYEFVKKICVRNICETIRPKISNQTNGSYVTSGSIKLYLDNQYTVRLDTFHISEYYEILYNINERNTILE